MGRVVFKGLPLRTKSVESLLNAVHLVLFVLFCVVLTISVVRLFSESTPALLSQGRGVSDGNPALTATYKNDRWDVGLLLLLATAGAIATASKQLPAQNVLLASTTIALIGGGAHILGAISGVPFGPFEIPGDSASNASSAALAPGSPVWAMPLVWVTVILNARGVARLILRRFRARRNYGFWVIGVTVSLVVAFQLGFDPYCSAINGFWSWRPTKLPVNWYATPVSALLGWLAVSALALAFATPCLINKKTGHLPPAYFPLAYWALLNALFLAASVKYAYWTVAAAILAHLTAAIGLALYGAAGKKS